jgi:hypothetical protein
MPRQHDPPERDLLDCRAVEVSQSFAGTRAEPPTVCDAWPSGVRRKLSELIGFAGVLIPHVMYGRRGRRGEVGVRHFTGYIRLRGAAYRRSDQDVEVPEWAPSSARADDMGGRRV